MERSESARRKARRPFITGTDALRGGKPIYYVVRVVKELDGKRCTILNQKIKQSTR